MAQARNGLITSTQAAVPSCQSLGPTSAALPQSVHEDTQLLPSATNPVWCRALYQGPWLQVCKACQAPRYLSVVLCVAEPTGREDVGSEDHIQRLLGGVLNNQPRQIVVAAAERKLGSRCERKAGALGLWW